MSYTLRKSEFIGSAEPLVWEHLCSGITCEEHAVNTAILCSKSGAIVDVTTQALDGHTFRTYRVGAYMSGNLVLNSTGYINVG